MPSNATILAAANGLPTEALAHGNFPAWRLHLHRQHLLHTESMEPVFGRSAVFRYQSLRLVRGRSLRYACICLLEVAQCRIFFLMS